jgi:CRP/FNR family cyclic AMP-dependent transcriptional regulator
VSAGLGRPAGRPRLVRALEDQMLLRGDAALAEEVADLVTVITLGDGEQLFLEGAEDDDMAFILTGAVEVVVRGRAIAVRRAGQHVGEMALLDPGAVRSASVVASGKSIVARISEPDMSALAARHPRLWRHLACELAARLRQRNDLVVARNETPHLFIGSSAEQYPVAQAMAASLASSALDVVTWKMSGIFVPSSFTLLDLEVEARRSDFAVLVLGADDVVRSRRRSQLAPRDNVILELGMFIGACGHERVFLLVPGGVDLKIPSDLYGITTLRFTPPTKRSTLDVAAAADDVLAVVARLGAR